jgi:hypothetical protein
MITIEKGEKGKRAAMIINAPPHFLTRIIYLSRTLSEYDLIRGLLENQNPIKYDTNPPMYERIPSNASIKNGSLNFEDQITNRSGGIMPRKLSEIKNTIKIKPLVWFLKRYSKT